MTKMMRAIGLMSGTSMDGIDIALIETDGETRVKRGPTLGVDYPPEFRARLRQAVDDAKAIVHRTDRPGCLTEVEREITERHADAVLSFIGDRMLQPFAIDVIGFHGQTVLHRDRSMRVVNGGPEPQAQNGPGAWRLSKLTVQLGDGPLLARKTGIDVVYDLRAADCAAGGEGAPLVPVYHRALVSTLPERPVAVLNIGGVANVTWIGRSGDLVAFDVGPGNAMIDDWTMRRTGQPRDEGGALAARGRVDEAYVTEYLKHSHFAQGAPKSLDRNAFAVELVDALSTEDGAATLTAFAAAGVARAREHFPEEPELWVVTGGGRKNRTLMEMIAGHVENAVAPAELVGLNGDSMEAEAWAYLAVRSLNGLPITFPHTTGVERPLTGGALAKA